MATMNVYTISFLGKYPIGAYAVVVARCERHAKLVFLHQLYKEDEFLASQNATTKSAFEIQLLCAAGQGARFHCRILSLGDY